ncbi:MAG TPA: FAD-dependent oxidoreductase [Solirubrobacterales bacterium]|nr:FAD-dependent oxidoreductase [Solirubrobacterales bacterium]HNC92006.1 FAD-dependent oxidoreductase [Solirubrobacterales bacterium]HNE78705.1 FAD-dependent oxidoreductase [Solirubrobacterales bacterium]HNK65454.1 FAD-dependent oxidoreductase [Solirubrobacterales bacterium]HNN18776.1 FAD-dependent oxidoreductase [Solirubrobacterales bacterium]
MSNPGTPENPLRVAIIGAGPSGFYAADQIIKDPETHAQVDLFDRLPTPYGLVRGGVAPDHPKIKSVTRVYEKTAAKEGFRFFGNVEVGRDLNVEDFEQHYHAIIYTFGAEADRELGIPGEDLPGSYAATAFVGWYNAHPDYADRNFKLDQAKRAVVIGNGNVALDVARMLALDDAELRKTDIADHAIELLDASTIEEIVVLGRRGPAQAAYTNPEVKELGELEQADVIVSPEEIELDPASKAWIESDEADKTARVNVEIVQEYATRQPTGKPKKVALRFLSSPVEIKGGDRVESIVIGRNELVDVDGNLKARDTGEREELACDLILRSVGYTGVPLRGVPFDERRGTILNEDGRVLESHGGDHRTGHYTAGWIKRGPSGVIGTNKKCATETVAHVFEDVAAGRLLDPASPDPNSIEELLRERGTHYVSFSGWEKIDAAEVGKGEPHGRPRVKFVRIEEMLETAAEQAEAGAATGGE